MQGRSRSVRPIASGNGKQQPANYGLPKKAPVAEVDDLAGKIDAIDFNGGSRPAPEAGTAADGECSIWTIKVKTLTGRQIAVQVAPTELVATMKLRVEEQTGIPPEQQRLILGGKQLADDKTLQENNVKPGYGIHLVVALRGGG